MKTVILSLFLAISVHSGVAYSQETPKDTRTAKLAKITEGPLLESIDALDELLNSKDQITRSLALEEALKSKERRVREVGFKYFAKNIKKFLVELSVPQGKADELQRIDRLQNNGGRFQRLLRINSILVQTEDFNDNNHFRGNATELGQISGMIANGSLKLIFVFFGDSVMSFDSVSSGYIMGSLTIPNNTFAVRIPLQ